jgi:hypothetical protein
MASLDQRDPRACHREEIGDGAPDDSAADDDDVGSSRSGQRPAPTSPATGLEGMA